MQETFVRAIRAMPGFRGDNPRGWLFAIARNVFLTDAARSRELSGRHIVETSSPTHGPEQSFDAKEALASLPEPFRAALILRDQMQLPYEEVAQILGKSLAATKVTIHRARKAFRQSYGS